MNRVPSTFALFLVVALVAGGAVFGPQSSAGASSTCEFWVAPSPNGSDANPGTKAQPWASLTHAVEAVPDQGCVVWFEPGVYLGGQEIERRFITKTKFSSAQRYRAVFEHSGSVIDFDGARNVELSGFEVRHSGPGSAGYVVNVDQGDGAWAEDIVIRDNVIHDSWDNDLLKVHNGSRRVTVTGNVFYNQGPSEQHMDVNSVTDVVIEQNIFFNDFAASGRADPGNTKHFIVVKDSNEGADGLFGTERVTIARNVFLHWQGGSEDMIKVGNDGKAYHEAEDVRIDTNLFVGNSSDVTGAPLGVSGAKDVYFVNNSIVGDLPSKAFGLRVGIKGSNPKNENIRLHNNIWSDPTGTMGSQGPGDTGAFSSGDPGSTTGAVLRGNAYWNGGNALPSGDFVSPSDDPLRITSNPGLPSSVSGELPRWNGSAFESGNSTIRQELVRLAQLYGSLPALSPAVGQADPTWSLQRDLIGRSRGLTPSLGAMEPGQAGCVPMSEMVGLVDPAQGLWHLCKPSGKVISFYYGVPGDIPFAGDWNCDDVDTPGLYRESDGFVYLRNSNTQGNADIRFFFGNPGDVPLAGDFDGDGCDTVSLYRPAEGRVYVMNELGSDDAGLGAADFAYYFGNPGDKPFAGDFDADGVDTVGLHRESSGLLYFRNSNTQGVADFEFYFGNPNDRLVAGDWNGDGSDTPGVFRPGDSSFYLRFTNTPGFANETFWWGQPSWLPVSGHFEAG